MEKAVEQASSSRNDSLFISDHPFILVTGYADNILKERMGMTR